MSGQGTPLGEAQIPIRAVLDKLDADLAQARSKVEGAVSKIGSSLQTIGKAAMGAIGVAAGAVGVLGAGIVLAFSKAIPAASNLNEALNATSVVFGDAAGVVQEFGRTAADVAGLSASEFNQMAAQAGAMLQNYGLSADEAATATIDLATRAADMASIFNTDVSDAMMAINAAMRGEADPIERFGVSMNMAAVEAQALAMGFEKVDGQFEATALTQARLALLMQQTDAIAGDFVNTSDQLANATRVNAARWENFLAQVGGVGLPIMTTVQSVLMDVGEKVFPIVTAALEQIMPVVTEVTRLFSVFVDELLAGGSPIDAVMNLIGELGMVFGMSDDQISEIIGGIRDFIAGVQDVIAAVMPYIEMAWDWITQNVELQDVLIALGIAVASVVLPALWGIVTAAAPVIAVGVALVAAVALVRQAWENDWGGIRTALTTWWEETGSPIFEQLKTWLAVNIPKAIEVLKDFWENTLLPAIQAVWNWIATTLIPFFQDVIVPWLQEKIPAAIEVLKGFWENTLLPAIQAVWNWIATTLIPFFQDVIVPWLQEKIPAAIETLKGFWENTLLPAIQAVWAFVQDSVIPLFQALVDFFDAAFTLAITAMAGLWQNVLQPAFAAVADFISETLQPVFEALEEFWTNTLAPALETTKTNVLDKLKGVFEGIRDAVGWVIEKLRSLTDWLENIELPAWLTPGSPTPFELGLRGIGKALAELSSSRLPQFSAELELLPVTAAGLQAQEGSLAEKTIRQYYLSANYRYQDELTLIDEVKRLNLMGGV